MIRRFIPNLFTLGNLFSGLLALYFVFEGDFKMTFILIALGIFLDFFDGFFARMLGVAGELGKQLDSLADNVTSGVVPGFVMYFMLLNALPENYPNYIAFVGLLLALAACYRLAKFNIDTRQTDSFIGLPTPSMNLFVSSLPLIANYTEVEWLQNLETNYIFLLAITFIFSYLMNAELPLFSLKFKNYQLKNNVFKYLLIVSSIVLIITLQLIALPIIILLYIRLSVIKNVVAKE